MANHLPKGIPPVYRGGPSLTFKPHEVQIDGRTGLVKPTHGISIDADTQRVSAFGGAYLVRGIPEGLTIVQLGRRQTHFEIVPAEAMTPLRYQELLNQVELELFIEES